MTVSGSRRHPRRHRHADPERISRRGAPRPRSRRAGLGEELSSAGRAGGRGSGGSSAGGGAPACGGTARSRLGLRLVERRPLEVERRRASSRAARRAPGSRRRVPVGGIFLRVGAEGEHRVRAGAPESRRRALRGARRGRRSPRGSGRPPCPRTRRRSPRPPAGRQRGGFARHPRHRRRRAARDPRRTSEASCVDGFVASDMTAALVTWAVAGGRRRSGPRRPSKAVAAGNAVL